MALGTYLKQQRSFREITLDEVAKATRISKHWLEAIECDEFERLPGELFLKGYVRAYADYIGLDVDDVLLRLDDEHIK